MNVTFRFWIQEKESFFSIIRKVENMDCSKVKAITAVQYNGKVHPYENNYGRILLVANEQSQIDDIVPILMNESSVSEILINDEFLQLKNNIVR